jgi:putative restriction endonuclease
VLVSEDLNGSETTEAIIIRFHGQPVRGPSAPTQRPDPAFTGWHRREVFRGPALHL